ncbi:MAG: hypothetical protein EXS05_06555 [Planctomycetaceae bacterium]|nr:hypothetical protein [Planctomycetaceae bacterium]
MTEPEYVDEIWRLKTAEQIADALRMLEAAVGEYPTSAELLCLLGDMIQLSDGDRYQSADALAAYQKAVAADPCCCEAYESLGYYYDVYTDDFERAENAFRTAIEFGAGPDSYAGLARVLAERGNEAVDILSFLDNCPYATTPEVLRIRSEIERRLWNPM